MNRITTLDENQIFVFGSNLLGIHGAGAAMDARKLFGAKIGVGVGRTGRCYAIPTKRHPGASLPLPQVAKHVAKFIDYARVNPYLEFLVTPIGCGMALRTPEQMAPMFVDAPSNVVLPPEFLEVLKKLKKPVDDESGS